ncbi:helix-turn-helix transcriptional regulator [Pseudonocardia sp. 73-21]|uniref:helix-turn-helix domain-containing protein n=1 Tax=Pseudonocardia sp. 73-21 TaxID=1895809 RepID=UPI000968A657|nr:helix-turn-helix transcriptional regulator [Pseudonocardia sp. 73-21]OJY42406.1 MAG: hypothetical protein BGP03_00605 [Pseudonocardia sp. 73-21]
MSRDPTPVTSRRELARTLRALRNQHGLSLINVHDQTGISPSFLSRVERGIRGLSDENIDLLCALYQAPSSVRRSLRQLATLSRAPSWWDDPDLPRPIREYIGVEQVATAITIYGSIVPGILQTRAYAVALTEATAFDSDSAAHTAAVAQRLQRQRVLDREDPPWVSVVLDESAIRRPVGNASIMRDQLEALESASRRPRTSIQVIPFEAGAHPGLDSRFVMLSTNDEHKAELVHVEGLSGFRNFEKPREIGHFDQAWQRLSALALSPPASVRMITEASRPD